MPKGVARLQFKRRQSGQVKRRRCVSRGAQGAERDGVRGGVSPPYGEGCPLPDGRRENLVLFDLNMEHLVLYLSRI